jgi:hypothetical protein
MLGRKCPAKSRTADESVSRRIGVEPEHAMTAVQGATVLHMVKMYIGENSAGHRQSVDHGTPDAATTDD